MIIASQKQTILVHEVKVVDVEVAYLVLTSTAHPKVPTFYPRVIAQCEVRCFNLQQRRNGVKSTVLVELDSCDLTGKCEGYDDHPWWFRRRGDCQPIAYTEQRNHGQPDAHRKEMNARGAYQLTRWQKPRPRPPPHTGTDYPTLPLPR